MSSLAVPVTVNVVDGTMPLGPVMEAVGVRSEVEKVSNLLTALAEELPLAANVLAITSRLRLPVRLSVSDQVVLAAPVAPRVALMVLAAPQVTRSSCR